MTSPVFNTLLDQAELIAVTLTEDDLLVITFYQEGRKVTVPVTKEFYDTLRETHPNLKSLAYMKSLRPKGETHAA